ncbi:MAG: alanine--tRNA ligase-related protein, partial [Bacteroidota bacterium]
MFIEFFQSHGHFHHVSSPLALSDYDSTMFTIAGMKQFTDYFLCIKKSNHSKIVTIQPCLRVNDIDMVGKTKRHQTLFEMIGIFSFGDYFKKEAIDLAYEFITKALKVDNKYLFFTV